MKKIFTTIALAASCGIVSAQTVVNGDFTSNNVGAGTFTSWNGSGTVGTINGPAATVSGYIQETPGPITCKMFDKAGKCISYSPGPSTFSNVTQFIEQGISITNIPEKLTGNYIFGSTLSNLYGKIQVSGTFNGKNLGGSFQPAQVLQVTPFEINISAIDCEYTKGSKNPCYFTGNQINIIITSCIECPQTSNINDKTTLTVDDLSFSTPTGIEDELLNGSKAFYPNPAKDILHVSGSAEIFDLVGNKVASGTNEINIEHLLSGIYVVKANGKSQKIVKE